MKRTSHVLSVLGVVVVSVIAVTGPVAGASTATGTPGDDAPDDEQVEFAVIQGDECYQVTPVGYAWENVSSFYDYTSRNSEGTAEFQANQVSNLLIFHGTEGYSLVILHDQFEDFGESSHGGTATMELVGLPESGEWVVEDDNYEDQDDTFLHRDTRSKITWYWIGGRTDGGAFRGLNTETLDLTITPRFNERSEGWGDWDWSGDEQNRTEAWRLFTDRETTAELNMTQDVTIRKGTCGSDRDVPSLVASSTNVSVNEPVVLDARGVTDGTVASQYQWDLDGDGRPDRSSNASTITHEYDSPGEYEASVKVRDGDNSTATGSLNVTVVGESDADTGDSGADEPGAGGGDADTARPPTPSSANGPGFGPLAGVLALVLSVAFLVRRF